MIIYFSIYCNYFKTIIRYYWLFSRSRVNYSKHKAVLTHGFVVDENGRKQSKSLGNVVSPQKVWDNLGADRPKLAAQGEGVLTGDQPWARAEGREVYTDGSGYRPRDPRARRCAWAMHG